MVAFSSLADGGGAQPLSAKLLDPVLLSRFRALARLASLVVMCLAVVALLGWVVDSPTLKGVGAKLVAMNPGGTALAFLLAGGSLRLLLPERLSPKRRRIGMVCGAVVCAIGCMRIVAYGLEIDFGPDRMLFPEALEAYEIPNRMAPNTALGFVLIGAALVLLNVTLRRSVRPAEYLSLAAVSIALLAVIGYAYSALMLAGVKSFIPMALNTAVGFGWIGAGILFARPRVGLMALVSSRGSGGIMVRRLLPAALFVPALVGWMCWLLQQFDLLSPVMGLSLFVLTNSAIFSLLIYGNAAYLNRADAALEQARLAAVAASRAKSEFLANMSHEIRTPMNGILGMTEIVLESDITVEQRECLGMVKSSAEYLLAVINDILDFSKIEAGKLEIDAVDFSLRDVLDETMGAVALRAHSKGLELAHEVAVDVPDALRGDPGRLRQVVLNLVGNAIKFTERGEVVVRVELDHSESEDGKGADAAVGLHFAVADTGIGIPPEKQDRLFKAFSQLDASTTRKYGGTGLGLAISLQLVRMMHGRMWVESRPGLGSTFYFTLRLAPARSAVIRRTLPDTVARLEGLSVLAVDDNGTNRRLLASQLASLGVKATVVSSGAEALRAWNGARERGEPFSLLITDNRMPEMDGFELIAQMERQRACSPPAVMMISSADRLEDARKCVELGVAAYLTKPIRRAELVRALLTALQLEAVEDGRRNRATTQLDPTVAGPLRVLLAEDNLVNQRLAIRLLEKVGHTVTVVGTGTSAVEAAARQKFDLVLMDVQMPEMDGFEATRLLRELEARGTADVCHLPIVAMTAHAMKGDRERCLEAGMDAYVSKPIRPAELYQAIATAMKAAGKAGVATQRMKETFVMEIDETTTVERLAAAPELGERLPEGNGPDWTRVLQQFGGDDLLLRDLMEAFLEECEPTLRELRLALARRDASGVQLNAHKLKGAVRYFDVPEASRWAQRLEDLGRQGDLAEAPQCLAELEREAAACCEHLTAFLATEPVS